MKKIALIFGVGLVALVSCPQPQVDSSLTKVSGTVVDNATPTADPFNLVTAAWTGGAGDVLGRIGSGTATKLGSVAANGTFTAILPATVDAALLHSFDPSNTIGADCTGQLTVSDTSARTAGLTFTVDASKDGSILPFTSTGQINETAKTANLAIKAGSLIYADRPLSITGSQTCKDNSLGLPLSVQLTSSLNLLKGWNLVTVTETLNITATTGSGTFSLQSGSLPTDQWVYGDGLASPLSTTAQSVKSSVLKHLAQFFR